MAGDKTIITTLPVSNPVTLISYLTFVRFRGVICIKGITKHATGRRKEEKKRENKEKGHLGR